jgi:general stress protein 26
MDTHGLMARIEGILEAHGAGILATVVDARSPSVRWLTPAVFKDGFGVVYALTSPTFPKVAQIRANPRVEWMFQTPALDEVITARGKAQVVDNPSLRSRLLETIGRHMLGLWRLTEDVRDLSVLETVLEEATYYKPMEGIKETVSFLHGRGDA